MKNLKNSILAMLLVSVLTGLSLAQPPTTAKTFRMLNTATSSVSITADPAATGTGTFTWPQPALGIFKSTLTGVMSIGAIDLSTGDVTGTLTVNKGGTGNTVVGPINSVAYSDGSKITYTAAPPAGNTILVSIGGAAPTYSTTIPSSVTVPFTNISNGTNTTAAMLVGSGATLFPNGTGQIGANVFVGTGSTSNAVDLNTAEVAGILPVGNGGTGVNTAGPAGSVFYSTGPLGSAPLANTGAGTTGQVLAVNGSGNPAWTSITSPRAVGRTAVGAVATLTINSGVSVTAATVITVTIETTGAADPNGTYTFGLSNKVGTSFDVVFPFTLTAGDFVNWAVY